MVRFLIFFQYVGTKYSGLAKASQKWSEKQGVLDVLEEAIQRLTPIQVENVTSSCRTDSGVHALVNTIHVDLERPSHKQPFTPHSLVRGINRELVDEDVRVIKACKVQDTFHARHNVVRRDYLYRVVLGCEYPKEMPLFEENRSYAIRESHLDIQKMEEASRLFIGLHDFASFRNLRHDFKDQYTKREMYSVSIYHPCSHHDNYLLHPFSCRYLYLEFSARSYLYRQIRRMVGVLLAVGRGRLTPSDVQDILQSRDNTNLRGTKPAPAGGLYLKDVIYDEKDLQYNSNEKDVEEDGDDSKCVR